MDVCVRATPPATQVARGCRRLGWVSCRIHILHDQQRLLHRLHSRFINWEPSIPEGYDSHADYMGWVKPDADARAVEVRTTLLRAFAKFVEVREIEVINISAMTAMDLAAAI